MFTINFFSGLYAASFYSLDLPEGGWRAVCFSCLLEK